MRASAATASYRVWNTSFTIRSTDRAVLAQLDRICHQFAAPPAADAVIVEVSDTPEGEFSVAVDGQTGDIRATPIRAAQRAEWWMMRLATRAESDLIHLHGAVLIRYGRSVLIPGLSGTGKSTLALAMTAHGFDLVADDISFADLGSATLRGVRRAPHIHNDAIPLLAEAGFTYPAERKVPGFLEVEALDRWHDGAAPLPSLLLFVDWDDDGPSAHHPITQAEAAIELSRSSYNLKRRADGGWTLLAELLRDTRCARLIRGPDFRAASELVAELLAA